MYRVYLGLGSDTGQRLENLRTAVEGIGAVANVVACSAVYETEPVDMESEDRFLNMAMEIETPDDPPLLLVKLRKIERTMGRKPHTHRSPRIIDIDILLYRGMVYEDHLVRVPHPELARRRFALEPLHEIAPAAVHPGMEKTIGWLLRNCHDAHEVRKTGDTVTAMASTNEEPVAGPRTQDASTVPDNAMVKE